MKFITKQENAGEKQTAGFTLGPFYLDVDKTGATEIEVTKRLKGYVVKINSTPQVASNKVDTTTTYSFDQIRSQGGIDAFSAAIGNAKSIKAPSLEFTDDEWTQMNADLTNDR